MTEAVSVFAGVVVIASVGGLCIAGLTLLGVMTYRMIKRPRRRPRT